MCTNGINNGQLEEMINLIDDHIALEYRWVHKLAHMAEDADLPTASDKLHAVQVLMADTRAALDVAREAVVADAAARVADDSTVRLV
jgi:hypothetical protein